LAKIPISVGGEKWDQFSDEERYRVSGCWIP
jgi:hypothetical protein